MPAPGPYKPRRWTQQDIKSMLATRSIVPPPEPETRLPRWYWPLAIGVVLVLMFAGFYYGVYVR